MGNLSNVSFQPMLKTLFYAKEIQDEALKNHPALDLISKNTSFGGDGMKVPLSIADIKGRSASFADAQSLIGPSSYRSFFITRVNDYAVGRIDGETLETSQTNKEAFMQALEAEVKRGRNAITRSLGTALYRDNTGAIGTITAVDTTIPLTFFDVSLADGYNLELGMDLNVIDNATNTLRSGSMQITGIDRSFSATTCRVTVNALVPFSAIGDRVCCVGDFGAKLSGFQAWIPDTAAQAATTLFGVNRADDVTRLGGLRYNTNAPIEEAMQSALSIQFMAGAKPDYGFMNPLDFKDFSVSLGAKALRTEVRGKTGLGYNAIAVDSAAGTVNFVSDPDCPQGKAYLLQLNTWTLFSAGEAPHILEYGGGQILRVSNEDAVEFRMGYRAQLACSAPGYNQVVLLNP